MKKKDFICSDCITLKKCKEPGSSLILFIIGIIATLAVRLVNVFLDFSPLVAKLCWYTGNVGFFIFFLYKYRYDMTVHGNLASSDMTRKLLNREALTPREYDILGTVICRMNSNKDMINYFVIFISSAITLIIALYIDIILR